MDRRPRGPAGHAPPPVTRGAVRLGGPHRRRRGSVRRRHAVRDRPGTVSGAGSRDPHSAGGDRRPPPVEHRGLGPRSDLQPPATRAPRAGRERSPPLLHPRRPVTRGGREAGRGVSRPGQLRAHGHPGLDAGAGPVAPSRNRGGRGAPVPDPGQSDSLLRPDAPALGGRAEAQRVGTLGPLGPPDLRRPPDRPGPDRRARGSRNRPTAPPRSRVLAPEGAGRRPRHPERAGGILHRAAPDLAGGAGPGQPVRRAARTARDPRERVHPAQGPPLGDGPRRAAGRRPGRPAESPGDARRATRARRSHADHGRLPRRAADPPWNHPSTLHVPAPSSSSSMAWGASATTDANTSPSSARGNGRRLPGSTSSRIPASASRCRSPAPDTRGRSTVARISSRRGRTIRSATRPGRRSTSGTRRPARSGARPRCPSGRRRGRTSRGMVRATAASSTPPTALPSTSSSSSRSRTR